MPLSQNQVSRHPRISLTAGMSEAGLLTQTELPLSAYVCVGKCVYVCVWQALPPHAPPGPRLLFPRGGRGTPAERGQMQGPASGFHRPSCTSFIQTTFLPFFLTFTAGILLEEKVS